MEQNQECPFCRKEIHSLAIKCPYCQSSIKPILTAKGKLNRIMKLPVGLLSIFVVMFFVFWFSSLSNNQNSPIVDVSTAPTYVPHEVATTTAANPVVAVSKPKAIVKTQPEKATTPTASPISQLEPAPAPQPAPTPVATSPDFTKYTVISMGDYIKNPLGYFNVGIQISAALVNDFLAKGARGGITNYLEIMNSSGDRIELEVDSQADYQNVVYWLTKGDTVNVYGVGGQSKQFTSTGPYGSYDTSVPVIVAQRINRCKQYACSDGVMTLVFSR